eukprot:TRINITY_DN156_c0_g1_i6.p4 TRINITY_DN156_c0_g1~~TRINITY_DN156_c0_g1_i6.p4  ORF type:complete len:236 (+),score=97.71 TRINITY_DN156_c0_g1_i6:98-709(+)
MVAVSAGTQVKWTGIVNDQQWTTANNWYPAVVPGANDDVTIDDAESKDATVVLVQPTSIGSLTMGNMVANSARLRVLANLTVARTITVQGNGHLEINSGAAQVTCPKTSVKGELAFLAGAISGAVQVDGLANFGTQAAKVFDGAAVTVNSTRQVAASGSLQFKQGSVVTANTGVVAEGSNFQCIVMDASTGNAFEARGFAWKQ